MIYVGTAGWSIPRGAAERLRGDGSHLARYARVFPCVEINTSFYREHSRETYARWASQTPAHFRFAVKIPQTISHENQLRRARAPLMDFLAQVKGLRNKLGPLLLQLPPSLQFHPRSVRVFFSLLRDCHEGSVVCEPRHISWFEDRANALMSSYKVVRVAADPAVHSNAFTPSGYIETGRGRAGVVYYRLHGAPRKYWSSYSEEFLNALADQLSSHRRSQKVWCVFDNTASGAAMTNALQLQVSVKSRCLHAR
jgi:uncharacterized protein YecE (DUF72 family)